jgi:hypothetical protein
MIATCRCVALLIIGKVWLTIDEEEERRLNIQHRGWKATNGGKNYVAPMDEVLGDSGEGKRIIDIGTGTSPEYGQ